MGAEVFFAESNGKTAEQAFVEARRRALWENGNDGYTGSIAEKNEFTVLTLPSGKDAYEFANQLVDNGDPRVQDKWGPAGCVDITNTGRGYESKQQLESDMKIYLFFGWASS